MTNSNNFGPLLRRPSLLAEIEQEQASRSLREFVRQAWAVIEPSTPFVPGWHIDAIVEHLEAVTLGQIRKLLINVPPRHMKSLLVSVLWPAWEWIRFPERRWLYSSYAAQLSIRDSVKCRCLIESPWYQQRWSDRYALTGDQNTKGRFENDKSGYRLSRSVGGAATGEGGDRVVSDDPHNVQEAESDSIRKGTTDRFDVVMSTRVNDPRTAAMIIVMQRCHQRDLSGHVLEQGGWEHLCLAAEYEGPGRYDFDRLLGPPHFAGRTVVAGTVRPGRNRIAEAQSGQLCGRGPASAAAFARGWRPHQAALVPLFPAPGLQPPAGDRFDAGRNSGIHCRG
jgi:hypothetical protein